jgi:hypothetical protein
VRGDGGGTMAVVRWATRMRLGRSLQPTVLLLVGTTVGAMAPVEPPAAPAKGDVPSSLTVSLRDQHGRADSVSAHLGRPLAVLVVSARRLRRLKDWQKELDRRVDGVGFLRIADVPPEPGEPSPRFEEVAARLRKRVPEDVPVLVDLERRFARELDLDTREVNVLLLDATGGSVARLRGRPTPETLDQAATLLLALPGVHRRAAGAPSSR